MRSRLTYHSKVYIFFATIVSITKCLVRGGRTREDTENLSFTPERRRSILTRSRGPRFRINPMLCSCYVLEYKVDPESCLRSTEKRLDCFVPLRRATLATVTHFNLQELWSVQRGISCAHSAEKGAFRSNRVKVECASPNLRFSSVL